MYGDSKNYGTATGADGPVTSTLLDRLLAAAPSLDGRR